MSRQAKPERHGRPQEFKGTKVCRLCGGKCEGRRSTFCSDLCVHEWRIQTDAAYCRHLVSKRDKGICACCGLDTFAIECNLHRHRTKRWKLWQTRRLPDFVLYRGRTMEAARQAKSAVSRTLRWALDAPTPSNMAALDLILVMARVGLPTHRSTYWDMDHIVPVAEGGGKCGLDNLQTLCFRCHKAKTKAQVSKPKCSSAQPSK